MSDIKRNLSSLDVQQIQRAMYSEASEAMRVEIVSGSVPEIKVDVDASTITEAIKAGMAGQSQAKEIQVIEVPKVIIQTEIREIQIPVIVKETEFKEIEKTVTVVEYKEIERPVYIPQIKIIEIEKPIVIKQTDVQIKDIESPKYIPILFIIQTLAILALVAHMFKRG